jgi:hypothetical protein
MHLKHACKFCHFNKPMHKTISIDTDLKLLIDDFDTFI